MPSLPHSPITNHSWQCIVWVMHGILIQTEIAVTMRMTENKLRNWTACFETENKPIRSDKKLLSTQSQTQKQIRKHKSQHQQNKKPRSHKFLNRVRIRRDNLTTLKQAACDFWYKSLIVYRLGSCTSMENLRSRKYRFSRCFHENTLQGSAWSERSNTDIPLQLSPSQHTVLVLSWCHKYTAA